MLQIGDQMLHLPLFLGALGRQMNLLHILRVALQLGKPFFLLLISSLHLELFLFGHFDNVVVGRGLQVVWVKVGVPFLVALLFTFASQVGHYPVYFGPELLYFLAHDRLELVLPVFELFVSLQFDDSLFLRLELVLQLLEEWHAVHEFLGFPDLLFPLLFGFHAVLAHGMQPLQGSKLPLFFELVEMVEIVFKLGHLFFLLQALECLCHGLGLVNALETLFVLSDNHVETHVLQLTVLV